MDKLRIYIGGVGGVGKTIVGQELARRNKMKHFCSSHIMMNLCQVNSREELSKIPKEQQILIEKLKYPNFVIKNPRVIIDGHCELLPEQAKCFDKFIYLTAPTNIIKKRRICRQERQRCTETNLILTEQNEYDLRKSKTEKECGIKFINIINLGSIMETCKLIEKTIKI